jgi:hypothetical protein
MENYQKTTCLLLFTAGVCENDDFEEFLLPHFSTINEKKVNKIKHPVRSPHGSRETGHIVECLKLI